MALSAQQKRFYRSVGHELNPVVTVANKGLTEGVLAEISRGLKDHELVKVRLSVSDRTARHALIPAICEKTGAILVQAIGKIALLYKKAEKPDFRLSNLLRYSK